LKDKTYRQQVIEQFEKRKAEAAGRSEALFSVFENKNLSTERREALQFLYAFMSLCDLADYDGDFFLKQVNVALQARDYFSWGKTVPDDIFRHFVLVYRVNNEYLDTARAAFFEELKDRVKNLSMAEAALEVNHWCHEKVTYRGTDARTSAPLALVCTSWGRCGEESTFTATALRAVGIPARQCYTPRWVHTDDNHAWVEAWIDGSWHYLGACEPEPELDVAWFTAPVKRTMMVHTNVFGLYNGNEEKNTQTSLYSVINTLPNYTKTRRIKVRITDENNRSVEGATVKFKVYNYAEFYPVSIQTTDKDGYVSLLSGAGDLFIWANKNDACGYAKSEKSETVTVIKLDRKSYAPYEEYFVMNVPPEQKTDKLSPEKINKNALRLAYEDSVRNAYMNTFISQEQTYLFAEHENLNREETWKYLNMSQGNWKEIQQFIRSNKNNPDLFPFLATLSAKDLRDAPAIYLSNHLQNSAELKIKSGTPDEMIVPYILSPRIENELIKPWRSFFQNRWTKQEMDSARNNVNYLIEYVKNHIKINNEENYYNCRITPQGVYELGIADEQSRNIFFVAMCRSMGIPSRIETATSKPQYFENGRWIDVIFENGDTHLFNLPKAQLIVENSPDNAVIPSYYTHYTFAYFKDGDFHTLDFENNPALAHFPYSLDLDEGYYRLTVGSRANDGSVSVYTKYFTLKNNKPYALTVQMPEVEGKLFVKGIVDMNAIVKLNDGKAVTLKELSNGKGLMLCVIDPGKEPSKHILQDLPAAQNALEQWEGGILLMIPENKSVHAFDLSAFTGLPQQTVWTVDISNSLLKTVTAILQTDIGDNFPLTVYLSDNGGLLYSNAGYKIGTGEDILKIIRAEESLQ
jgi:transglutaminase-like putative cysteine protease